MITEHQENWTTHPGTGTGINQESNCQGPLLSVPSMDQVLENQGLHLMMDLEHIQMPLDGTGHGINQGNNFQCLALPLLVKLLSLAPLVLSPEMAQKRSQTLLLIGQDLNHQTRFLDLTALHLESHLHQEVLIACLVIQHQVMNPTQHGTGLATSQERTLVA